jgi:hypothetical protein
LLQQLLLLLVVGFPDAVCQLPGKALQQGCHAMAPHELLLLLLEVMQQAMVAPWD